MEILTLIYLRVVNSLLLRLFHNPRKWGGEKCEAGECTRQLWAGQRCFRGLCSTLSLSSLIPTQSSEGVNSAGKAGSAAVSWACFCAWQHCHLIGLKPVILEGGLFCRPHQIALGSGLLITVSFHGPTLAPVAKFSVMSLGVCKNPSPLEMALAIACFQP